MRHYLPPAAAWVYGMRWQVVGAGTQAHVSTVLLAVVATPSSPLERTTTLSPAHPPTLPAAPSHPPPLADQMAVLRVLFTCGGTIPCCIPPHGTCNKKLIPAPLPPPRLAPTGMAVLGVISMGASPLVRQLLKPYLKLGGAWPCAGSSHHIGPTLEHGARGATGGGHFSCQCCILVNNQG